MIEVQLRTFFLSRGPENETTKQTSAGNRLTRNTKQRQNTQTWLHAVSTTEQEIKSTARISPRIFSDSAGVYPWVSCVDMRERTTTVSRGGNTRDPVVNDPPIAPRRKERGRGRREVGRTVYVTCQEGTTTWPERCPNGGHNFAPASMAESGRPLSARTSCFYASFSVFVLRMGRLGRRTKGEETVADVRLRPAEKRRQYGREGERVYIREMERKDDGSFHKSGIGGGGPFLARPS